jgi:hypothetical protein
VFEFVLHYFNTSLCRRAARAHGAAKFGRVD